MSTNPTREEIEVRAYELYLDCGCKDGHDLKHWLEAEQQLSTPYGKEDVQADAGEMSAVSAGTQSKTATAGRQSR